MRINVARSSMPPFEEYCAEIRGLWDSRWLTNNGEIFNHADIRPELEAAGHRYKSHCDTETIVHAYEQWGDQSVTR